MKLPLNYVFIAGAVLVGFLFGASINHAIAQVTNSTVPVSTQEILGSILTSTEATIGSAISLILIILKWADSIIKGRKDSAVKRKYLEFSAKLQGSLKETDVWIKDNVVAHNQDFSMLFGILGQYPTVKEAVESEQGQALLNRIKAREIEAKNEIDKYYGWASKVSGIDSTDPNIAKLAELEQFLTPAGPTNTTTVHSGGATLSVTSPNTSTNDNSDAV